MRYNLRPHEMQRRPIHRKAQARALPMQGLRRCREKEERGLRTKKDEMRIAVKVIQVRTQVAQT